MAAEAPEASMALAAQALMVKRVSEFFFNVSSLLSLRHSSARATASAFSRQLKRSCRVMTNVLSPSTGVACRLGHHVHQPRTQSPGAAHLEQRE
jgi:hypothetical protein